MLPSDEFAFTLPGFSKNYNMFYKKDLCHFKIRQATIRESGHQKSKRFLVIDAP